jgi:heat shock protein HslJ
MRAAALGVVLALALVGAGCGHWSDAVDSRSATAGLPTTLEDLEAHRWALDPGDSSIAVAEDARPTIAFDDDAVHGSAGCNLFRGGFSLDGDEGIEIEGLSTTRRLCPELVMTTEQDFLAALADVDTVDVNDDHDRLVLQTDHGPRLAFTADDPD